MAMHHLLGKRHLMLISQYQKSILALRPAVQSVYQRKVFYSTKLQHYEKTISLLGNEYKTDDWTNVSPRVLSKLNRKLHNDPQNPIYLIKRKIQNFFYVKFVNRVGNPLYTMVDDLNPVVTTYQNFDSLLVPENHVSRLPRESYYINKDYMLRAHTSAHQEELMKMGLDKFLVSGDVYRRDAIDSSHYPIFHQMEGVCLFTAEELFSKQKAEDLKLFDNRYERSTDKQETHSMETAKLLEQHLKNTLLELTFNLFGKEMEYRWVDEYFPFTHPSWELEIMHRGEWLEVLGSGIIEQQILKNAGVGKKVGWAFGLGLDRLAMLLYQIPDIRLLWSEDERFSNQFATDNIDSPITFQPFSNAPSCINDISFWIPSTFCTNDFYDLVRNIGSELVEEVTLIDEFTHPKTGKDSHCYRIMYRHTDRPLTQEEVNLIHQNIRQEAAELLGVELR